MSMALCVVSMVQCRQVAAAWLLGKAFGSPCGCVCVFMCPFSIVCIFGWYQIYLSRVFVRLHHRLHPRFTRAALVSHPLPPLSRAERTKGKKTHAT